MKEFESFVRTFALVELFSFSVGVLTSLIFKGFTDFTFSFAVGYLIMAFDYYLLIRFSRHLLQQVLSGYFPKSGFLWRYLSVLLILVGLSLFTRLNFFAIILAVTLGQIGMFISVVVHRKERRKWREV